MIQLKKEQNKTRKQLYLTGAKFVDPYDCDKLNDYVSILVELRKKKGMTPEEAKEHLPDIIVLNEKNEVIARRKGRKVLPLD